jgi:hypothetical protein
VPCASEAPQAGQTSSSADVSAPQFGQETMSGKEQPGQSRSSVDSVPQFGQTIAAIARQCPAHGAGKRDQSNASPSRDSSSSR